MYEQEQLCLQTEHLKAERNVLKLMNFPFVVRLLASFQDDDCVYFVMEYSCGGEFFKHLKEKGRYASVVAFLQLLHALIGDFLKLSPKL